MNEKRLDDLGQPVCDAVGQLTTWVRPVILRFLVLLLTIPSIAGLWQKYIGEL